MNLQETNTLKRLDETCNRNNAKIIETQFGDVLVKETLYNGFVAVVKFNGKVFNSFDKVASVAFLNLGNQLKGQE